MTYTWQSVTKNLDVQDIGLKVDRRLDKIKKHVQHFPQDSVHLNISLEKNPKKRLFTAALTLHLPSNILHAEKTAENLMTAFDNAADALVREIDTLKSDLRGADQWERKERRAALHESKGTRFSPVPSKNEVGENVPEMLPELWQQHESRLFYHIKQAIRRAEDSGHLPRGFVDSESVLDAVEHEALSHPHSRPEDQSYKLWFHLLADKELRRAAEVVRVENRESKSEANLRPQSEPASYAPTAAREMRRRKFDPPPVPLSRLVGNDTIAVDPQKTRQLWDELMVQSKDWPAENRAVFELGFLEGFGPSEISALTRLSAARVHEILGSLQECIGTAVGRLAVPAEEVGAL